MLSACWCLPQPSLALDCFRRLPPGESVQPLARPHAPALSPLADCRGWWPPSAKARPYIYSSRHLSHKSAALSFVASQRIGAGGEPCLANQPDKSALQAIIRKRHLHFHNHFLAIKANCRQLYGRLPTARQILCLANLQSGNRTAPPTGTQKACHPQCQ